MLRVARAGLDDASYTGAMATRELDRIDRRILEILQQDGRITNQDLSERIALSPRACLDRVRRLERRGLIAGYMALIDTRKLGNLLTIVVEVTLKDQTQATHARFEQRARSCPEVIECFLVSGQCDYVLRLACRDLDHYRELTNEWTDEPSFGVEKIASKPELQTIKPFRGYPLP
jgi:DNA-binding Lrp family transcriptional regulator